MLLDNERALEKWIRSEFYTLNKNLVTCQVSIADLIKMETPKAITRTGENFQFNKTSLQRFVDAVPKLYHRRLKLPINFYKDLRVKDSCFITDEPAVEVLQKTDDLDKMYRFIEGKLWLSRPLAHEIANKYPTLFQFIVY